MKHSANPYRRPNASDERGGARLNFLVVVALIGLLVYAGSQYVPVAIQARQFQDLMYQKVTFAAATGKSAEWLTNELKTNLTDYDAPLNATISALQRDGRLEARVSWTQPIKMPGFVYRYEFDHTTRSDSWLTTK